MMADNSRDDLFKLPLAEFTAARNALAASLKAAGHAEDGAAVKALAKPSLSAWVVNQLYWRHRKPFDLLMAAGERLRKAQVSQLAGKGGEMRAPIDARRVALADLTRCATTLLRESGHPATPDLTRRITTTLEALATYGSHPGSPPAGRLTADLDPPGFEVLSALVPAGTGKSAAGRGSSRVIPFRQTVETPPATQLTAAARKQREEQERKAKRRAAQIALREAERMLRDARTAVAAREAALRRAAARAKVAEKTKTRLEKRLEQASSAADTARQEARKVASAAEEAAQALQDAERAMEKARRELPD
jgi:hypothetical protein